jgi:germination protein M
VSIRRLAYIIVPVVIVLIFTGCRLINFRVPQNEDNNPEQGVQQPGGSIPIDPHAQARERQIVLYFKHEIADLLVPEIRKVVQETQTIEQLIVEELLKGPQNFERRSIIPQGTELLDVTRRGDTVFVNLTREYLNDIDLSTLPGKETVNEENAPMVQAEMKRLSIYSIVHSLTYLDGVNQVKLLVDNRQPSYEEMGAELLLEGSTNLSPSSPMMAVKRNKGFNLTPAKSVEYLLNQLAGEPDWEKVYFFLSDQTMDGNQLPPLDELKSRMPAVVGGFIEFEGNPVLDEEITIGKAFVPVKYTLRITEPKSEIQDVLTVDNKLDGIWKVRLPSFLTQLR